MVHAFIMVKTSAGKSSGLLESIESLESVEEAFVVAGNYDIITEIDAPTVYDVLATVSGEMQGLDGVLETRTYIAMQ